MLTKEQISCCRPGLDRLAKPVLPLARLAGMLYLTGPFATLEALLEQLTEPVETAGIHYEQPAALLQPYLDALRPFERIKVPQAPKRFILTESLVPAEQLAALDSWVGQEVLTRELEGINSLLCGPCNCTLCCTGPSAQQTQEFFEIPLADDETSLFALPRFDHEEIQAAGPDDDPPLAMNGQPFYANPAALYHWRTHWSMILPRASRCPHLDQASGGCLIYPVRPEVCRWPQIFPYLLEREPLLDQDYNGCLLPAFVIRAKLLAIWDCPYVRQFQEEIIRYAELCELEPVFKQNKA